MLSIGKFVQCDAAATARALSPLNRLCKSPRETYLRLRGGSLSPSENKANDDDKPENLKERILEKLKEFAKSISNSVAQIQGNRTEDAENKKKQDPPVDEDDTDFDKKMEERRARVREIRRLIQAQEEARRRRDNSGDERMVTLIVPPRQSSGIVGFISYVLAHPLLFFMCIDTILGLATRKSVPDEVITAHFAYFKPQKACACVPQSSCGLIF